MGIGNANLEYVHPKVLIMFEPNIFIGVLPSTAMQDSPICGKLHMAPKKVFGTPSLFFEGSCS